MNTYDVVIAGGGISGLACAFWLQRFQPELKVLILESAPQLGGRIGTRNIGDYRVEAGPDSFVSHRPGMPEFIRDLGLESRLRSSRPEMAATYLWNRPRLQKLPAGLHMGIPSRPWTVAFSPVLSLRAKVRLALEHFVPTKLCSNDESLGSFVRRRLGAEALEALIGPLSSGIFGTDPEQLSIRATFPHLAEYETQHGSLTKAMWKNPVPKGGAAFQTFPNGMQELIDGLASQLSATVKTGTQATNLSNDGQQWSIEDNHGSRYGCSNVVLALPSNAACRLTSQAAPEVSKKLAKFSHSSGAAVHFGLDRKQVGHSLKGYGFVCRYPSHSSLVACTWSSQKFSNRAADDKLLVRAFLRNRRDFLVDHCSEQQLIDEALSNLRVPLQLSGHPEMVKVERYQDAFPHYHQGHLERVARFKKQQENYPGLHCLSTALSAGGIPACVSQAKAAAEAIRSRSPLEVATTR
jgi:oxygen-dependent protoporphyrinogen oxidase